MNRARLFLASACAFATLTVSQAAFAQAPVAVLAPATGGNILRAGTEVTLRTVEALVSDKKTLRVGHRVQLQVAENVMLNGMVVIPAGSPALGEVTDVRYKGMWGKSGGINARVTSLRVGDRQIRMTGAFDDRGKSGTAGVVAAIAFVPVAGFFVTGTSAKIPAGSFVKGFLDEDIAIAHAVPAAPLVVTPAQTVTVLPAAAPVATAKN